MSNPGSKQVRVALGRGYIVVGALIGGLLGSLVGLMEGVHQIRTAATQSYGYASDSEDRDPLVTWPLLGLVAGAVGGVGGGQLYQTLRGWSR